MNCCCFKEEENDRDSCRRVSAGGRGGRTVKTDVRPDRQRVGALLAALVLLLSVCPAGQAETPAGPDFVTMILAEDAVRQYDLRDAEGNPLTPRAAPEMKGRGNPDVPGEEPDYRGAVGYMVLQSSWDMSRFSTFASSPWVLPVYEPDGRRWKIAGDIQHKTPVLVTDQRLKEGQGHKFVGYLQVVRLDSGEQAWIDVTQFVTVPYWTMDLEDAVGYGYCIAVYSGRSGISPVDRKGNRGTLAADTRVLMCDPLFSLRYISPDRENNPLLGIVFRDGETEGTYYRTFLFFSPEDLTLVY